LGFDRKRDGELSCKIVRGEIPSNKVYEDDQVFAFRDITPQAPTHILVIPKQHIASVAEATDAGLIGSVVLSATDIARSEGLEESGYRLVCNHGKDGGQTVSHIHVHLLGGRPLGWPPG
jgi:histidine triad (HIT) family protein